MPAQLWVNSGGTWGTWGTYSPGEEPVIVGRDHLEAMYGDYKPDLTNTGCTDESALSTHSGSFTTSSYGEVVENLEITGRVYINHAAVVFRNCKFLGGTPTGPPTFWTTIKSFSDKSPRAKIYDSSFVPSVVNNDVTSAFQGRDIEFHRCYFEGSIDGISANGPNVQAYGCYIKDLPFYADAEPRHSDGTHNDGIAYEGAGAGYVIKGCRIEMTFDHIACVYINQNVGPVTGVTIDKNWFYSVGGTDACDVGVNTSEKSLGAITNFVLTNNRFSDLDTWASNHCALIKPATHAVATISGNIYESDGMPAKITAA